MMGLIEKLQIQVSGTRFNSDDTVRVDFRGVDQQGEINLSGYVVGTLDEYFTYAGQGMAGLQEFTRQKIVARLNSDTEEQPEAE
ncbi:hypothetical protein [Bacillus sp. JCM 19034]|uniref:hypothetical protein n=1 Tax=Bacillus sp. JCM 19034 TaxID=1481928 RepID=UPI000A8C3E0D|nr:hypothetical protein [Bacillus sp. JCM 19034]